MDFISRTVLPDFLYGVAGRGFAHDFVIPFRKCHDNDGMDTWLLYVVLLVSVLRVGCQR